MSEYRYSDTAGLAITSRGGFKTIWVVDSIPPGELPTAKELFDDVLTYQNISDPGFNIEYVSIISKSDLFACLERIYQVLRTTGAIPLIHFETHGNREALVLSSGERVTYEELFPALSRINILSQNSLFIAVAACHGAYLGKMMVDAERSPFWAILGPTQELTAAEVLSGNRAFYNSLLQRSNWNDALQALRNAIPDKARTVNIWTSEHLFILGFNYYFNSLCEGSGLTKRIKQLVNRARVEKGLNRIDASIFAEELRDKFQSINDRRREFEKARNKFFMHDLYPENHRLPCPSYEHVMQISHDWTE